MSVKYDKFLGAIREGDEPNLTAVDQQRKATPFYWSDFLSNNSASFAPFYSVGISSGGINSATHAINHPGVIKIVSSAGGNSGACVGSAVSDVFIVGDESFEAIFSPVAFTNITSRIGIHSSSSQNDAANGVYLEIATTGVATGKTADDSNRSETGTTYTLETGTWYGLRIIINCDATSVLFEIHSDAGVLLWSDTLTTNIPNNTGNVQPAFVTTTAVGGVTDLMYLDYMSLSLSTITRGKLTSTQAAEADTVESLGFTPMRVYNVIDYGAAGDGVTDDTVAIQNALNAVDTTGGIVFFPIGTYLTGALDVSSMTTCLGTGISSKLKLADDTNDFMFTTRDTAAAPTSYPHDHQFRDLYFDLNKANNATAAGAIKSTKNRNAIIERCSFVNYKGNCVYFSGADGNNVQPRILNNQFDLGDRTDGVGIKLDTGCYDSLLVANDVGRSWRGIILSNGGDGNHSLLNNWTWANADCGIYIYQSDNVLLANNTQDQNYGTTADGAGLCIDGCDNVSIVNNKASNNSWRDVDDIMGFGVIGTVDINPGIRVFGASTNIRISNSIFSNPNGGQQYGIKAEGNSVVYFANCTFTDQESGNINMITGGVIVSGAVEQAATASAPTYVKGALYFDTTTNKLMVGGATAWETITSA